MATAASNNTWPHGDIYFTLHNFTRCCLSYKWQQRHQTTHGGRYYTLQKLSRCCRYTRLLLQMTAEASDTTWLDNRLWTAAVSSRLSLSSFPGLQTHVVAKNCYLSEGKTTISISLVSLYWTRCNFSGIYDLYLTRNVFKAIIFNSSPGPYLKTLQEAWL